MITTINEFREQHDSAWGEVMHSHQIGNFNFNFFLDENEISTITVSEKGNPDYRDHPIIHDQNDGTYLVPEFRITSIQNQPNIKKLLIDIGIEQNTKYNADELSNLWEQITNYKQIKEFVNAPKLYKKTDIENMLEDVYMHVAKLYNDQGMKDEGSYRNEASEYVKNYLKDK